MQRHGRWTTSKEMSLSEEESSSYGSNTSTEDYYSLSYEDEACDQSSSVLSGSIFIALFLSIIVVLSLFGNILVIMILVKYENLRSLTNALILNLALSDLLFTAGLPFWAYSLVRQGWGLGAAACKAVNFVFYVGYYSSGLLLVLMTAHRYVAVTRPLSSVVSASGFSSFVASSSVWTVSICGAIPALVFTGVVDGRHCVYVTSYWGAFGIYQQNALFALCSVVFAFCYCAIVRRLLRPSARRRKNKSVKLIFTLVLLFFVGWTPYNALSFLRSLRPPGPGRSEEVAAACEPFRREELALSVSRILAFAHCCINPVFYVFVGVKYKKHLENMLKSWGRSPASVRPTHNRLTVISITSGEELSL